ncbi:TetR/AcrR family transcriptional regulator [Streptomyces sp. NPDC058320]|uniref:TetR/AcrR family transcriptional regulator n=1 Tax=unclassified Streptomyces TaxID=2593676 RepID=UPI003640D55D
MPADLTTPRTRQEQAAGTRALILGAAIDCLVEHGYSGASTLAIQARAGVSRGRLLHHFPSRDELLVAAAQHLADVTLAQVEKDMTAQLADEPEGPRRTDRCIELIWDTLRESHFWAAMELWIAARTNPALAAALRPHERGLGAVVRSVVDSVWGPTVRAHPQYPQLSELLLTSMRGVALVYGFEDRPAATDPHLALWKSLAHRLLDDARPEGHAN